MKNQGPQKFSPDQTSITLELALLRIIIFTAENMIKKIESGDTSLSSLSKLRDTAEDADEMFAAYCLSKEKEAT
jgi:hypothetical protein